MIQDTCLFIFGLYTVFSTLFIISQCCYIKKLKKDVNNLGWPMVPFYGYVDNVLYCFEGFDAENKMYYGVAPKGLKYGDIEWVRKENIMFIKELKNGRI